MKKSIKILIATLLTTVLVFTGCSSDKATAGKQGSAEGTGAVEASKTEEAKEAEPIVLRCGVKQAHPPYSYLDDNGELVGLDEDVVTEVFNRLEGYEVEFVGFNASPELFSALQAGSLDFVSGQYVASAERRELYQFPTQCYNLAPMYLVSREEDHFQNLEDIAGETLEFVATAFQKETIGAYNESHPGQEINMVDVSGDVSEADKFQQILTGQRNVTLTFKGTFDTVTAELGLTGLVISDEPVIVNDVYQVFSPNTDAEFIELFDQTLKEMLEDGTLGEISEKWTGENAIGLYNDLVIHLE